MGEKVLVFGEPGKLGMVETGCDLQYGAQSGAVGRKFLLLGTIDTGRVSVYVRIASSMAVSISAPGRGNI